MNNFWVNLKGFKLLVVNWPQIITNHYNAFCNSLQRFDFKGTLGPEGMLASDWLLPCVITFSCSKNWHFWSLLWGSSLLFWFWWREFQNSENLTTNLKNVSFLSKKKWQTHLFKNWRGFCTKLDTWHQPIRSKHSFRSKGPLEIEPLKRVTKSIIVLHPWSRSETELELLLNRS